MKAYIFLIFLIPACANALYNCEFQPTCLKWDGYNTIVSNAQELQQKCNDYNKLVKCMDEYGKECIGDSFSTLRGSLLSAYGTVSKLCTDETYKREYLQESGNFAGFKDEYNKCVDEMSSRNNKEGVSITQKAQDMCCYLENFKDCVDNMCKDCSPKAAKIFKEMVNAEYTVVPCPPSSVKDCPKNSSAKNSFNMIYLAILMMFYVLIR